MFTCAANRLVNRPKINYFSKPVSFSLCFY